MLFVENPPVNSGDIKNEVSILGWGRSTRDGNGNPLQFCFLENPIDRGPWQATVHGVSESRTRLSDFHFTISEDRLEMAHRVIKI